MSQALEMIQSLASQRLESAKAKPNLSAKENISNVLDSKIDCAERERVDRPVKLNESLCFPFDLFLGSMKCVFLYKLLLFF